ncbi:MAG TPA: UDP-glucuronic acid decarboxylase family protein [Acidimicrobiia bacterium]|nr:UDP-glucuronic acid decarboxylase family protein [Acidimicrobiia bacterium]
MAVNRLQAFDGARVVVLGGAGFLGSHICETLIAAGADVVCVDSFLTGSDANVRPLVNQGLEIVEHDIRQFISIDGEVDYVFNYASPASPVDFERWPIEILKIGSLGTHNALGLALAKGAMFLQASTSEVYGDPLVNPQPETYWGNVNPIGVRGVYDEGKRFGEALTMAYHRAHGLRTRIVRIFNTHGPRMRPDDGRAVPAFCVAALRGEPIPVHGDGSQTRSLCYVDDLVRGMLLLALSEVTVPVNIGNPDEITVLELAETIRDLAGSTSEIQFLPRPADDPMVRRPDIARATELLGWEPEIGLTDGLSRTLDYFRTLTG